jgi:hypothetical protein
MPENLAFYRSTKWVQRSAVTDFPQQLNVLTVGTLSRPRNEWSIPGGLRHISRNEWQSYRGIIHTAKQTKFDAVEPNSTAFGGRLRRVDRSFEGAAFFDLLLNRDGKAFELRAIDLTNGFDPMVMHHDADAAPRGYARIERAECRNCHARAGESAYASGNVPGGGMIFSFPLLTED